jgi:hypothetical protein
MSKKEFPQFFAGKVMDVEQKYFKLASFKIK